MSAMLNVQKGVPLPEINRTPKGVQRKYPIDTMAVGDMFFVEGRTSKSVSAYISRISKGVPGKFSARRCVMAKYMLDGGGWEWRPCEPTTLGATEGTGVWRIE